MKLFNTLYLLVVTALIIQSCTSEQESEEVTIVPDHIVLIFENTPEPHRSELTGASTYPKIEYVDDDLITREFAPDPAERPDTFVIDTRRDVVEIRHNYRTIDKLSFLFQNGDTAVFRYEGPDPIARVINRNVRSYDLNYEIFKRRRLTGDDYPAFVRYSNPMAFADYSNGFEGADARVLKEAQIAFDNESDRELHLLDSLVSNDLLSQEVADFHRTQTQYRAKTIQLQEMIGPHSIAPLHQNLASRNFYLNADGKENIGDLGTANILDTENRELFYNGYFRDANNWLYVNYLSRKVGRVTSVNYINDVSTAGSNIPDYMSLADTIARNDLLSDEQKKLLLFENLKNIIQNNSIDDAQKAFEDFRSEFNDSNLVKYIKDEYGLDNDIISPEDDLQLLSLNSQVISFNDLIKEHSGKVIHVDFWGSYCKPCIDQFPDAKLLAEQFADREFVQIYISIEPKKEQWMKACEKYHLTSGSYFATNRYTSRQLESLQINYLPHHMLFNRNGELITDAAPGPTDPQLKVLIEGYLLE